MRPFSYTSFAAQMTDGRRQHKRWVYVSNTKLIRETLHIMYESNLILSYHLLSAKQIQVFFKHTNNKCNFKTLKVISLPSKKKNVNAIKGRKFFNKATCVYILSTKYGLRSSGDCVFDNTYGEVLMQIIV